MNFQEQAGPSVMLAPDEERVVRRVYMRLSWFLFVLSIAMSIDRTNIGFAALQMNKDLGISATTLGVTITIFSIGYILSEIPSNVLFARLGAKIWLPRIAITWGLIATATMFSVGPNSLYVNRFALGLAEGGFLPGVLLYLSIWLPESYRARAMSLFLLAQPVSFAINPLISAPLLQMGGVLGLAGWQWLFLIEGLPSVGLGVFCYFYLTDRPRNATWLSAAEKNSLERVINRQENTKSSVLSKVSGEYRSTTMFFLALTYFGLPMSLGAYAAWSPQIVRALVPPGSSFLLIGLVNAIPPAFAIWFMPWWSARSDRSQERTWHTVTPLGMAMVGWLCNISSSNPYIEMIGLTLAITGAFAAQGIFFTLATAKLSPAARPVGIAMISATGLVGAALSTPVTGFFRDLTGSFSIGLGVATVMLGVSIFGVLMVSRRPLQAAPVDLAI
jgi:ACS family 4-hydroxyphenylacetate permease-like MFS transporter